MVDDSAGRRWRTVRTLLGGLLLVLFLLGALAVVAALAFSLNVSGSSMRPTLADGDRLLVDPFDREVKRFDIVEAHLGENKTPVVKRVVGMPGDEVQASIGADGDPLVLVRPAGSTSTYRVASVTWPGRTGVKVEPCCLDDGTVQGAGLPPRWVTVPKDSYWLIGDNWGGSDDSRAFGFITEADVLARVIGRLQPLGDAGRIGDRPRLEAYPAAG